MMAFLCKSIRCLYVGYSSYFCQHLVSHANRTAENRTTHLLIEVLCRLTSCLRWVFQFDRVFYHSILCSFTVRTLGSCSVLADKRQRGGCINIILLLGHPGLLIWKHFKIPKDSLCQHKIRTWTSMQNFNKSTRLNFSIRFFQNEKSEKKTQRKPDVSHCMEWLRSLTAGRWNWGTWEVNYS